MNDAEVREMTNRIRRNLGLPDLEEETKEVKPALPAVPPMLATPAAPKKEQLYTAWLFPSGTPESVMQATMAKDKAVMAGSTVGLSGEGQEELQLLSKVCRQPPPVILRAVVQSEFRATGVHDGRGMGNQMAVALHGGMAQKAADLSGLGTAIGLTPEELNGLTTLCSLTGLAPAELLHNLVTRTLSSLVGDGQAAQAAMAVHGIE